MIFLLPLPSSPLPAPSAPPPPSPSTVVAPSPIAATRPFGAAFPLPFPRRRSFPHRLIPLDTVMIQLQQWEDQLKDKERELGSAYNEIKAMKQTDFRKDKALAEFSKKLKKMDEKLTTAEKNTETKNLVIKRLSNEKKEALDGQFAAEATLRRVHASQKDEEYLPIEAVVAPLVSEMKKYKKENLRLQEDKKVLQRIIKSKEEALIEAQHILHSALERVLIVKVVQNQNLELRRKIEICQDEKRALETDLARVRVSLNRVAMQAANEWKDEKNGVKPINKWLEERKCLQSVQLRNWNPSNRG